MKLENSESIKFCNIVGFPMGRIIYRPGGHLGHVTSIILSDFHFLVPESFQTKFGSDRQSSF